MIKFMQQTKELCCQLYIKAAKPLERASVPNNFSLDALIELIKLIF